MENIKFTEFAEAVVERIRDYLPKSFEKAEVSLNVVVKTNDVKLTGLTIKNDKNIAPTIYLEKFYESYEEGSSMDEILAKIADVRFRSEAEDNFDVSWVTDYSEVAKKLVPKLINKERNAVLLSNRPYTEVADLAVTYNILVDDINDGVASIPVNNQLFESWSVEISDMHDDAVKNIKILMSCELKTMKEIMVDMMLPNMLSDFDCEEDVRDTLDKMVPDNSMYVLSNKLKVNGATLLIDNTLMKQIKDQIGEFYILPSSLHEAILLLKEDENFDVEALENMISEVNMSAVAEEDILSDHVYTWTEEEGLILA